MGRDNQRQILSDLRDAHDGYIKRAWGSGKPPTEWRGKFGILAGATNAIDKQWKFFAELGERFLRINLITDQERQTYSAVEAAEDEDRMRGTLRSLGNALLEHYDKRVKCEGVPSVPDHYKHTIADLAIVVATLRSPVVRDRQHNIVYIPQAEVWTRLGKQFVKLAQALAILYHKPQPGDPEFELLLRVAADSIPLRRSTVLKALLDGKTTQALISAYTHLPATTVKVELEDLEMLKVVVRSIKDSTLRAGAENMGWRIEPTFQQKLDDVGLRERLTRKVTPEDSVTGSLRGIASDLTK